MFQYQAALKPRLCLDIEDHRNQPFVLTILVLLNVVYDNAFLSLRTASSLRRNTPKAEKEGNRQPVDMATQSCLKLRHNYALISPFRWLVTDEINQVLEANGYVLYKTELCSVT